MDQNPYAAPQAPVVSQLNPGGGLLETPQALGMNASLSWLSKGWQMFMLAPGVWVLMALLFGFGYLFMAFIPFGGFLIQIAMPIVLAGFYTGADRLNFGEPLEVAQITAGFSRHPGPLATVGVLSTVLQLVLGLPLAFVMIFYGDSMSGSSFGLSGYDALMAMMVSFGVLMFLVMVAVSLATWFAPMLIALDHRDALAAIRLSWRGCMRNLGAIVLLMMVSLLVLLGLVLTLGLGYLVVMPWYCCASYVAYRQIFYGD